MRYLTFGLLALFAALLPLSVSADPLPLSPAQAKKTYHQKKGGYVVDRYKLGNPAGVLLSYNQADGYFWGVQFNGAIIRLTRIDQLPTHFFPFRDTDFDADGNNDGLWAFDEDGKVEAALFARSSAATYLNADGLICTAAINEPRYGFYNMTSPVYGGLLLEQQTFNYLPYSAAFDNWSTSNVTVTADATAAPVFGNTTSADMLHATDAGGYVRGWTTRTAPSYYIFSVYLKAASLTSAAYISTGKASEAFTNQTTTLTTEWQRFSVFNNVTGTVEAWEGRIFAGQTTIDIYAFGAQLERDAIATSYIETTGASATRLYDRVAFEKPAAFDTAGTLIFDYVPSWGDADNASSSRIVLFSDDLTYVSADSILYVSGVPTTYTTVGYNDGAANTAQANQTAYTSYKYGIQWGNSAATVTRDDVTVVTGTYDGTFNDSSHTHIGFSLGGEPIFIRNVLLFDRADVEVDEW